MYKEKWIFFKNGKKILSQIRYSKNKSDMDLYYAEQLKDISDIKDVKCRIEREEISLF